MTECIVCDRRAVRFWGTNAYCSRCLKDAQIEHPAAHRCVECHSPQGPQVMWRGDAACGTCLSKRAAAPTRRGRYEAYRATSEWRERREAVMARDESRCRLKFRDVCTTVATIVHHLTYDRVGDEALTDLVATCEPCHRRWHEMERAEGRP